MKFSRLIGAATVCAALSTPVSAETILKMGSVAPSTSPWGEWATELAQQIEDVSGGSLKINLLLDAQAGDEQTITRQTARGRLDIAFVSNVPLTLLARELAVPSSAYLFDSVEQGTCVVYEHLDGILGDVMKDAGVVPLTWMEVGHYSVFTKEPIESIDDLKGLKVRTAASVADTSLAEAWGIAAVPMGSSDTIPALQTGTVDAVFFPTISGIAFGTHRIAPNVTYSQHSRLIGTVAVSERTWVKLTEQEQEWLATAFGDAGPKLTAKILGVEQYLLGQVAEAGINVKRLTEEEMAAWSAVAPDVLNAIVAESGGQSQAVADAIVAAKAACGS